MRITTQPTLLFLFFICLWFTTQGQTYMPETRLYDLKDGLSHRQINDILEDKRGFIWMATPSGLNRFDGYSFRVFGREDGLHSDQVNNVFEDAYGLIWVYYAPGVDAFDVIDPLSNKVFSFTEKYGDKILDGYKNKVGKPILTKDSTLYWATHKGFISFHPQRGFHSVTIAFPILSEPDAIFYLHFISEQKTFWGYVTKTGGAGGRYNLLEIDANGVVLQNIEYPNCQLMYVNSGTTVGSTHFYNALTPFSAVCTRISADNKVTVIPATQFIPAFNYFPEINAYFPFYEQNLLYSDLKVFDKTGKTVLFDFGKAHPEFNKKARGVLLDHTDKLWITTDFGLLAVNFHQSRFKRLLFNPDMSKKGISCRGILEKDNQLLICTEGAIFIGNKTTGVFQKYPNTFQSEKVPKGSYWYSLTSDKAGHIFVGSESDVKFLTPNPPLNVEALPNTNLLIPWTIYPDDHQRLWLGSHESGLSIYDLAKRQTQIFTQYNGFDELKSAKIVSIQADRLGQVWVCALTGFYKLDLERGILERHWTGGKGNMYLPYDNILHFYEDKDGIFWLGTGGGGLIRWDKKNNTTQQFSRKAGLPNNTIYAVYEDEHEHLWLPSDYGIIQFDKKRGQVRRVYLTEDGITNTEFNSISHYRGADGTLYFGSLNGVTAFNPNDFYEKEGAMNIRYTKLTQS